MVPFAGYAMPVQYPGGIIKEHLHTRSRAGLFDISHMGQLHISGDQATGLLEKLTPGDIAGLTLHRQCYTVLTTDSGGILDDLMITRTETGYNLVVNAGCKDKVIDHINRYTGRACTLEIREEYSLIALQGPAAVSVLTRYQPGVASLEFMQAGEFSINGINCFIIRSGYTGEDGFEISIPSVHAQTLVRELLSNENAEPAGLGARDSLRLEAGLCLYGHDIDEHTTPVEAGIGWIIARKYRQGNVADADFPGAEKILGQLKNGTDKIRIGIRPQGRIPVREGTEIMTGNGEGVGIVTSGGFGPTIGAPVAMGYVRTGYSEPSTKLHVHIRGRSHKIQAVKLPFVEHRYYKP